MAVNMITSSTVSAIFDLDGTLVDSAQQIFNCVAAVRTEYQLTPKGIQEVTSSIGLPVEELFLDCPPNICETVIQRFRFLLKREICEGNPLFAGSLEVVQLFRSFGWKIGVATSKPHSLARLVVEKSSLNGMIDWTQGLMDFPAKPDPAVILECKKVLPSAKYVMFGDRPEDMIAGIKAGCVAVGVAQSAHTQEQLLDVGASLVFSDMLALYSEVDALISCLEC